MHRTRWLLTIGWLILILSLFTDIFPSFLTDPSNHFSPFRIGDQNSCIQFQDRCFPSRVYNLGLRIFWGIIVPSSIFIIIVCGHETWRRICPLSFISQLPRALGIQRRKLVQSVVRGNRWELVKISQDSWLGRNALYLQFFLLFIGLNLRLLFLNSDPYLLGVYLTIVLLAAITVGYLYEGKTWCHYFCPMAPVQITFTGPRSLFGSKAHLEKSSPTTQSMCRTITETGREKSNCVGCTQSCFDIDAEQTYWNSIHQHDRKVIYYSYPGLVISFFLYFTLYSGNPSFVANGIWLENYPIESLLQSGFYLTGIAIPIPKLIAVPFTLLLGTVLSYSTGICLEVTYKRISQRLRWVSSAEQAQSQFFTIFAFISFSAFLKLGILPSLAWIHPEFKNILFFVGNLLVFIWLYRSFQRRSEQYIREKLSNSLRRQLQKLNIDISQVYENRALNDLSVDEVYVLAKSLPNLTRENHLQIYRECVQELVNASSDEALGLEVLKTIRKYLLIKEEEHHEVLTSLNVKDADWFPNKNIVSASK
jgi:hypothetical protein